VAGKWLFDCVQVFMKRVLCVRFPNWPIQCLQRRLRASGTRSAAIALHTSAPPNQGESPRRSVIDEDTRFIRSLFPSAVGGPAIVAVSMEAWTRGVRPGMPLAEARSMAQPIIRSSQRARRSKSLPSPEQFAFEFHEWQPLRDRSELKATAELTRRYAPIVGLDEVPMPDSLLLDITGCGPLFGGEAALAESLLKELQQAGWSCRIAIAQTVSAVWALTHASRHQSDSRAASPNRRQRRSATESQQHELPIQIVPPGLHQSETNPLPVAASRLSLSDLEILSHLGIRTIGQLVSLPREDLPARLSAEAILRIQQLLEIVDEPIDPLPEANPVAADWSSEEPATSLNDFRHVLHYLTGRIEEQLTRRRLACSSLACLFQCADGSTVPLTSSVVKPTQSSKLLHEVLCLRLDNEMTHASLAQSSYQGSTSGNSGCSELRGTLASLASLPVNSVSMLASVVPIPSARQRDLFSSTEHFIPQEELATLITRLSNRMGQRSVLTVRQQPDPRPEFSVSVVPVLPGDASEIRQSHLDRTLQKLADPLAASESDVVHAISRPLRLLASPQLITGLESGQRFPSHVMVAGKTYPLVAFSGPERIQTAWWTDQPCHRDYYQATARAGNRFWLFRELQTNRWFLHGIFD